MGQRTVTDEEIVMKNELAAMIEAGATPDEVLVKANAIAQHILDAAEAEASLKMTGHKWTDEQRKALSEKLKGRGGKPWTPEQRAKQKASWTPEKRAALSEKLKGRTLTPEQKAKLGESLRAGKAKKEAEQAALKQRIADLEAQLGGGAGLPEPVAVADVTASEPDPEQEGRQRGRRR